MRSWLSPSSGDPISQQPRQLSPDPKHWGSSSGPCKDRLLVYSSGGDCFLDQALREQRAELYPPLVAGQDNIVTHGFSRTQASNVILSSLAAGMLWLNQNSSLSDVIEHSVIFLFCSAYRSVTGESC